MWLTAPFNKGRGIYNSFVLDEPLEHFAPLSTHHDPVMRLYSSSRSADTSNSRLYYRTADKNSTSMPGDYEMVAKPPTPTSPVPKPEPRSRPRSSSTTSTNSAFTHVGHPRQQGRHTWSEGSSPVMVQRTPSTSTIGRSQGQTNLYLNQPSSNPSAASTAIQRTSSSQSIQNLPARPRRYSKSSYKPRAILFYNKHEPHYGFTNFSNHGVKYDGKVYPTSEHLFQSMKFSHRPLLAEHIRTCDSRPSVAFSEARRFQPEVRKDWGIHSVKFMDLVLWNKFNQHRDLKEELLATGDAELIENSDKDAFWGCGADGKGRNELGKALVRLRTRLRG